MCGKGIIDLEKCDFDFADRQGFPADATVEPVKARPLRSAPRPLRIVGQDNRVVSDLSDHRIGAVGVALTGPISWVGVDVGENFDLVLGTMFPQRHVSSTIEPDDPGIEAVRVQFVVADEARDGAVRPPEKERAAFTRSATPAT